MKFAKKYGTFIILFFSLVLIFNFFSFSKKVRNTKYKNMLSEGYVISDNKNAANKDGSVKYYFDSNAKYKSNSYGEVSFNTTENDSVKVPENSFVHYVDGSIAALKDTVILNLDDINDEVIKYYHLNDGEVITKQDSSYVVKSVKSTLVFNKFLMKLDKDKYLLAAPVINISIDGVEREVRNNYIEVWYTDGKIIHIENQEFSLQSVSSDMFINVGDNVKLDLSEEQIQSSGKIALDLMKMTLEIDDDVTFVETVDLEKEEVTTKRPQIADPTIGLNSGNIDDALYDNEEELSEFEKTVDPNFSVTNFSVTSNGLAATIYFEDENSLLTGDINVKVIDILTDKIVYHTRETSGLREFGVNLESLTPDTNYALIINSNYTKNGEIYNRDFIQKTFVTQPIGVSVNKNYHTTTELSYLINKESYSKIKSADITLLNNENQVIKTQNIMFSTNEIEVMFDNLSPDSEYKIILSNFIHDNFIISNEFDLTKKVKTLKRKPTFGTNAFVIDKKNAKFTLKLNNISDVDSGVVSYRYEVYDARTVMENPQIITSIEKLNRASIDIEVDDESIYRGVPYVFKTIAIFHDNEKEYEYETEYSSIMQMDGVEFPTVRFEPKDVTFERIEGNLIITDNGNTINVDDSSVITVVYTDSVGHSTSFTTSGNYIIPFHVNNLRANETYTISIYATVNLQDGNNPIENCFVGSVIVKTKETNPFSIMFEDDKSEVMKAFHVTSRLGTPDNIDNELEANTLTGITFNLYKGKGTTGQLIKSVKKLDYNLDPYYSQLKDSYYDAEFIIDPSFFGLQNKDLQEEFYTIEVTNSYDYTTYKNDIPIIDNVYIVKTNGYIPDLPPDVENAIEVNMIRNSVAGEHYQNDLGPTTVVGYKIRANYDNSNKYVKQIIYSIYNAETHRLVDTITTDIGPEGNIDYTYVYLDKGTHFDVEDLDFRRGNKYYFTYKALLDLNYDGVPDIEYPNDGVVLKSNTVEPEKEKSNFKIYPSVSTNSKITWKYIFTDVDKTLIGNKLQYSIGSNNFPGVDIVEGSSTYEPVELTLASSGLMKLYVEEALMKTETGVKEKVLLEQYIERRYTPPTENYNVSLDVNRVIITLLNYESNHNFYDRVAGAKVEFKAGSKVVTLDNLEIDNGLIVVDLNEIEELIGLNIKTEVSLYYDSGLTGFDLEFDSKVLDSTDKYTLMIVSQTSAREYFRLTGSILQRIPVPNGSILKSTLNLGSQKLNVYDYIADRSRAIDVDVNQSGVTFNFDYLLPKHLYSKELISDGSNEFTFNMIIPGVSLLNSNFNLNISPALTYADINVLVFGASNIKDDKIYVETYSIDDNDVESHHSTQTALVSDFNKSYRINNLNPKTNYYIKLYADIYNGSTYVRTQLYDIDFQNNTKIYTFKTLSSVGATNIKVELDTKKYSEKYFKVTYNLKQLIGYDRIEYKVYKVNKVGNNTELEDLELIIEPDYIFNKDMEKLIDINPGSGVVANEEYLIEITAFTEINNDGDIYELSLEPASSSNYFFSQMTQPYIALTPYRTSDPTIMSFYVNVYDNNNVMYGDSYQIQVVNEQGEDITPVEYQNVDFETTGYNKKFDLDNLVQHQEYRVIIIYKVNVLNGVDTIEDKTKITTVIARDSETIDIGNLTAQTNLLDPNYVNIVFSNSYKLTSITHIRYSMYNASGHVVDRTESFVPQYVTTPDSSFYIYTLSNYLSEPGKYIIQMQFLKDSQLVSESFVEYNFLPNN